MSEATASQARRSKRRSLNSTVWFVWMVGMWVAFFALALADRIDDVYGWVRDLPLLAELVVWVAFLPWLLGAAVWTSSWPGWLRLLVVLAFAAGWSLSAVPRKR